MHLNTLFYPVIELAAQQFIFSLPAVVGNYTYLKIVLKICDIKKDSHSGLHYCTGDIKVSNIAIAHCIFP